MKPQPETEAAPGRSPAATGYASLRVKWNNVLHVTKDLRGLKHAKQSIRENPHGKIVSRLDEPAAKAKMKAMIEYYLNTPRYGWERCDSEEHAMRLWEQEPKAQVIRRTITPLDGDPVIKDDVISDERVAA